MSTQVAVQVKLGEAWLDVNALQAAGVQTLTEKLGGGWRFAAAGAIGGPLSVGVLTPQRNAMTLAAKDTRSTYAGLYRAVFASGVRGGFRGGAKPTLAAVPQFTAIGPVYLAVDKATGAPTFSMMMASLVESLFTYSAQRRNAQIQYNATKSIPGERVAHQPLHQLMGPGFTCHVLRNAFAMTGIRIFSPYAHGIVGLIPGTSNLGDDTMDLLADLSSSICAATLSMPFNHIFSWASCTPELERMSCLQRAEAQSRWIASNYASQGAKLLGRDLCIRISYTGLLFTIYRAFERRLLE